MRDRESLVLIQKCKDYAGLLHSHMEIEEVLDIVKDLKGVVHNLNKRVKRVMKEAD